MSAEIQEQALSLKEMAKSLSPKQIQLAMKGSWSKVARDLRRVAVKALTTATFTEGRSKGKRLRDAAKLAKAIRGKAMRDYTGAIVAANFSPVSNRGMTLTRRGVYKPLAYWFDNGSFKTNDRKTRVGIGRSTRRAGKLHGLHYMDKAETKGNTAILAIREEYKKQIIKRFEKGLKK